MTAETQIGQWLALLRRSRTDAARHAETSGPRWLRFERERRDFLARVRPLFAAAGAALLVVPPGAGTPDLEDQALLGPTRYRQLLELVETVVQQSHPTLGATPLRYALARALIAAALQVAAPRARTTLEQVAGLAHALRTERYSLGFASSRAADPQP